MHCFISKQYSKTGDHIDTRKTNPYLNMVSLDTTFINHCMKILYHPTRTLECPDKIMVQITKGSGPTLVHSLIHSSNIPLLSSKYRPCLAFLTFKHFFFPLKVFFLLCLVLLMEMCFPLTLCPGGLRVAVFDTFDPKINFYLFETREFLISS